MTVQDLDSIERDIRFDFRMHGTIEPGIAQRVDFSIRNRSKKDRGDVTFTYYYPLNARVVSPCDSLPGGPTLGCGRLEHGDREAKVDRDDRVHCDRVRLEGDDSQQNSEVRENDRIHEREPQQPRPTVTYGNDRFTITVPSLLGHHSIRGHFLLWVSNDAKPGDPLKNVWLYRDDQLKGPVIAKTEEKVCHRPRNRVVPGLPPCVTVSSSIAAANGGGTVQVGDALVETAEVSNDCDVPADDCKIRVDTPYTVVASADIVPGYEDINNPIPQASTSTTIELGPIRGREHCTWRHRVGRFARGQSPGGAPIGGTLQVTSPPWGISITQPVRPAQPITIVAPVPVFLPPAIIPTDPTGKALPAGTPLAPGMHFRWSCHVRNTGHAPLTGTYVKLVLPSGVRTVDVSPGIGPGRAIVIQPGGQADIYCDHILPDTCSASDAIGSGFFSDQTLTPTSFGETPIPCTEALPSGTVLGTYSVGRTPRDIAFDSSQNAWVTNFDDGTVTKLSSSGKLLGTFGAGAGAYFLAIDASDDVWIADYYGNSLTELAPTGSLKRTVPLPGDPHMVAIDPSGNVWTAYDHLNAVSKVAPDGTVLGTFPTGSGPFGLAIDPAGNVYSGARYSGTVTKLAPDGTQLGTYSVGYYPYYIALTSDGNLWMTHFNNVVTELSPGSGLQLGPFPVGNLPYTLSIDPAGDLWAANFNSNSVSRLSPTGSLVANYPVGSNPFRVKVDAAGNAWVVDSGDDSVMKFVP